MKSSSVIVTLATAWGSKFGGINSFNTELVKSLGILPTRNFELICIVPGEVSNELQTECGFQFGGVQLCALGGEEGKFAQDSAKIIVKRLTSANEQRRFYWIGHDDKTGALALELKSLVANSRAVLINHMAYCAYQSIKKGNSLNSSEKKETQVGLFRNADLCLAVGPMLQSHLNDLLACFPIRPQVEMLVPGLTDPNEYDVEIRGSTPENFIAFVSGRLDKDDDRIKQGRLALQGFGRAINQSNEGSFIQRSPTLRMRGISLNEETELRDLLMETAGRAVNFDFQEFTDDRTYYFRDLASASLAMMPSWHEGFGLTAWEAIASALPVVISQESGVYRLLNDECSGIGLNKSVVSIHVDGRLPLSDKEPNYTEDDVERLAKILLDFSQRMPSAKQHALSLRNNLLRLGWDWKGTSEKLIDAIQRNLDGADLTKPPKTPQEQSTPGEPAIHNNINIPEWLRLPETCKWIPSQNVQPSMLLVAFNEIVNFDPERRPFLIQMMEWASWSADLLIRLIFAPGGMGKTRLALEFTHQLKSIGWQIYWLAAILPRDWEKSFFEILNSFKQNQLLFVVDNADTRSTEISAVLIKVLDWISASKKKWKLRILLLARSKYWIDNLHKPTTCSQELSVWLSTQTSIDTLELPPWKKDLTIRLSSYRQALNDFSKALGISTPTNAFIPRLSDKVFDCPLYLHLAALAALGGQRPASAETLLGDQIRLEWQYWHSTFENQRIQYNDWADALSYIIFCQGVKTKELRASLHKLGVNSRNLVDFLQRTYSFKDYIAPLKPDLIADALLRERLAEHRGPALLETVLGGSTIQLLLSIPVVARLVAQSNKIDPVNLTVWLQVLVTALVHHWPHHANAWLWAAHFSEPGLGALLFIVWQQLEKPVQIKLAQSLHMPYYSVNLVELNIAVKRQLLEIATDPASRAHRLSNLSEKLADKGNKASRTEALAHIREAVQIYRELIQTKPDVYLGELAGTLSNLANCLLEQDNLTNNIEALNFARESTQILRKLAKTNPTTYLSSLSGSLYNLSIHLQTQGESFFIESLACARESMNLYRELSQAQPAFFRHHLAHSLNNLANILSEQNDPVFRTQALSPAREALQIFRELAKIQPATYLGDIAMSLSNLSTRISELNDPALHEEALEYANEAVLINRKLVEIQPDFYLPELAKSLRAQGNCLSYKDDSALLNKASSCIREAVKIYHELVKTQPGVYLPNLADALRNQAILVMLSHLNDVHSVSEALVSIREAVQIDRELAQINPSVHLQKLAKSLTVLSNLPKNSKDATLNIEEFTSAREALQIYAKLYASMPKVFENDLNISVNTLICKALNTKKNPKKEVETILKELARRETDNKLKAIFKALLHKAGQIKVIVKNN